MTDQIKNMMIGFFVIIACGLIVGMILFIEPSVGDGEQLLVVRFSNINGISVGTRVLFAGKAVGEVTSIETIPHARQQPIDHSGNVYYYQLILHIDSSVQVYNTDEITLQTSGLLGEKSIAIIPKAPPKGVKPKLITAKTPVYAISTDPLENAFNELSDLSEKVDEALEHIISWFDQNKDNLSFAIQSFGQAMDQIHVMIRDVNETKMVDDLKSCTTHLSGILTKVDTEVGNLQKQQFFQNLASSMSSIKSFSNSLDIASKDIADGTGTLGKLITSDDMYLRFSGLMSKVDVMMDDINQYGILFNYNKQWQRSRLLQTNLINSLRTPESFKSYFSQQLASINESMNRISIVVGKVQELPSDSPLLQNKEFQTDFADLLKKVNELSSQLKLYNQEFIEMSKGQP